MGKATGFLEYQREENSAASPLERIQCYEEFHAPLSAEERKKQGARCMNCGVPFCQSAIQLKGMVTGCPLHNLIPEWNDSLYHGNYEQALSRLLKTSSFPEFTGRVCPALCEEACLCGIEDSPVTVRENELFLIETAFENGNMQPAPPSLRTDKRVAVIGSGPAGLAVADKLNKRGHHVTVYERDNRLGGLLMYGIPNMKLEKRIVERRIHLMEAEGVTFLTNTDVGKDISAKQLVKEYDAVVLCCGAKQPRDLNVEKRNTQGIYFAVDFLTENTKNLLNKEEGCGNRATGKDVVIVGGGDTGNDCVGTSIRQGCKSVVQIEMMPKPPEERSVSNPWPEWPKVLKTDYGQEEAIAKYGEDPRVYETTIKEVIEEKGVLKAVKTVRVTWKDGKLTEVPGTEKQIKADLLLIAAGFTGCEDYTAKAFGVELSQRNTVAAKENSLSTSQKKVFTAGDMHRGQSLVVWAIAEGRKCADEVDEFLMKN